jgi:hypothetical protein
LTVIICLVNVYLTGIWYCLRFSEVLCLYLLP